jgi:hypothetical protein
VLRLSFVFTGYGVELDFSRLAVTSFDGVDEAGADVGTEGEAVYEDIDWLGEVEFEEGFGGGELDDFSGLVKAVVASAAEFGEAIFEGVGDVDRGGRLG